MTTALHDQPRYDERTSLEDLLPVIGPNNEVGHEVWFNGININAHDSFQYASAGVLERLANGIFINVKNKPWMPEMTAKRRRDLILLHAPRIASILYTASVLGGASAYHCGPVDNVLCLVTGGNNKYPHRDIGGVLKIYHTHVPQGLPIGAPLQQVQHEDTVGPMLVNTIPDEVLLLQAFTPQRKQPPSAAQLSLKDIIAVIDRSVLKHGSRGALEDRLREISTAMDYDVQYRKLAEAIDNRFQYSQQKRPVYDYYLYWNRVRAGNLQFDGVSWAFTYDSAFKLNLTLYAPSKVLAAGTVPSFIGSVLPERERFHENMELGFSEFKVADRYLSNITVRKATDSTAYALCLDRLLGRLDEYKLPGYVFGGKVDHGLAYILEAYKKDPSLLADAMEDPRSPRISGVQIKLAGHLSANGVLSLANNNQKEFTHIIKPPPGGTHCTLGTMEWYGMALAKVCGMVTEHFALADFGGEGPTFIAERFDIPQYKKDASMVLLEDFWSIQGKREGNQKYTGDLLDVAKLLMKYSSNPGEDGPRMLHQVAFSWFITNSDLHLKNLMLLKRASPDLDGFEEIRLSPAYDMLPTNVYPSYARSAALPIGPTQHYTLTSFRALGAALGMSNESTEILLKGLLIDLVEGADKILNNLPDIVQRHAPSVEHLENARELMFQRVRRMIEELKAPKVTEVDAVHRKLPGLPGEQNKMSAEEVVTFSVDAPAQAAVGGRPRHG